MSKNSEIRKHAHKAVLQVFMGMISIHVEREEPIPLDVAKEMLDKGNAVLKSGGPALKQNLEDLAKYLREYAIHQALKADGKEVSK